MNLLVIGLGSMGQRRIRLLKEYFGFKNIYGYDKNPKKQYECQNKFSIHIVDNLDEFLSDTNISAGFICCSPGTHSSYVLKLLRNNIHTFSEINLFSYNYDEIIKLAINGKKRAFLSSTKLYDKDISWVINKIKKEGKLSYRFHDGQYICDWHPWETYKDFFVFNKTTNGIREIMAIQLPWIIEAFGKVKQIQVIKDKQSKLELNYPDSFHILFEHENHRMGCISFDILCRKESVNLEIYSENIYIKWDGTPNSLEEYDFSENKMKPVILEKNIINNEIYVDTISENQYIEEMKDFFYGIKYNDHKFKYNYEKDKYIVSLMDHIEREKK